MPLWTKKDLMFACKASDPTSNFLNNCDNIYGISIDDRTIKKGELFIALIGDNFDGHNFIEPAISKGACGVIVSNIKVRVLQPENIDINGQQKPKTKKDLVEKHWRRLQQ